VDHSSDDDDETYSQKEFLFSNGGIWTPVGYTDNPPWLSEYRYGNKYMAIMWESPDGNEFWWHYSVPDKYWYKLRKCGQCTKVGRGFGPNRAALCQRVKMLVSHSIPACRYYLDLHMESDPDVPVDMRFIPPDDGFG